ncbi:metallophosphoesterase family protein [Chloroflexota bacterium]
MGTNKGKLLLTAGVFSLLSLVVSSPVSGADYITSPLNGKVLEPSTAPQEYSFFIAGHIYGAPESPSVFPAASFLANIDMINNSGASFLVLTGDIFQKAKPPYIGNLQRSVIADVEIPIFNAVGNHDTFNRQLYQTSFGQTYYEFRYGSALYIILDGQLDNGTITGQQWVWLQNLLYEAAGAADIKNIFLFSHNLIWSKNDGSLAQIVYPHVNSHAGYENIADFKTRIMPEITHLSQSKKVFMISGDIGVSGSLPMFYYEDAKYNIVYLASGLGDTVHDAIIKVNIMEEDNVTFTPVSLTGEEMADMQHYGIDYWEEWRGSIFSRLQEKARKVLTSIFFQLGIAFTLTGLVIITGGFVILKKMRGR